MNVNTKVQTWNWRTKRKKLVTKNIKTIMKLYVNALNKLFITMEIPIETEMNTNWNKNDSGRRGFLDLHFNDAFSSVLFPPINDSNELNSICNGTRNGNHWNAISSCQLTVKERKSRYPSILLFSHFDGINENGNKYIGSSKNITLCVFFCLFLVFSKFNNSFSIVWFTRFYE